MKNEKNVLQISFKDDKPKKTKLGKFFQRVGFKLYLLKGKFKAWFYSSLVKLMYKIFPKRITDGWDKEWEEEMKDVTIQVISNLSLKENKELENAIKEGLESGISNDFDSDEHQRILREFVEKLAKNSKDIDPDINEMINENFWDLFDDKNKNNGKKTSNN
jgi:hypothetical protein